MEQKIHIIGIGDDAVGGLTGAARQVLENADVLLGDAEVLRTLAELSAEKIEIGGDLEGVVRQIEENARRRLVVLAQGDPLFYGTARFLCQRLGKERFDVVPHVSSMQLAFARVKESWDEAYLTNLAAQTLDRVIEKVRTADKVGIFTTESASPSVVARALVDRQIDYFTAYVCENLGSPDERVTHGELSELVDHEFSPLNVMILVRKPAIPDRPVSMSGKRLFGNPDEYFLQSQPKHGLLTPTEVRCVALAQLDIGPSSVVWDVGAGSGSVAIEAAHLAADGQVFAIERDPEDHQLISANAERFAVNNLTAVLGKAPDAWTELPDPDAIFVGGTGRNVDRVVALAFERLRPGGRLVSNVGSIEFLETVRKTLHSLAGDAEIWMFNIAKGVDQLERLRFEALNPTFLIRAVKEGA